MLIGEFEETITVLKLAIERHEKAELYYQLSNCYFHLKMHNEGNNALVQAIYLDATILEDMKMKYPQIKEEIRKIKAKK
jgi:membrane-bound inhibitor of C-type lysozyme